MLDLASLELKGEKGKLQPINRTNSDHAVTLPGHMFRAEEGEQMRTIAIDTEYKE